MEQTLLTIVLAPLAASVIAGFLGRRIGRVATHSLTIAGVAVSCAGKQFADFGGRPTQMLADLGEREENVRQ